MSTARQSLKRPAPLDSDNNDLDVLDLCSSSSCDEGARMTGNTGVDGNEDSDSEADDTAGTAGFFCYGFTSLIV